MSNNRELLFTIVGASLYYYIYGAANTTVTIPLSEDNASYIPSYYLRNSHFTNDSKVHIVRGEDLYTDESIAVYNFDDGNYSSVDDTKYTFRNISGQLHFVTKILTNDVVNVYIIVYTSTCRDVGGYTGCSGDYADLYSISK